MTNKKMKSFEDKFGELKLSLEILQNANNDFWKTYQPSRLLTIATHGRMLVGLGKNSKRPRLLELLDEKHFNPILFSYPEKTFFDEGMVCASYGDKTWFLNNPSSLCAYTLEKWMTINSYFVIINNERKYINRNEILKHIADKHGGAHYDNDISLVFEYMNQFFWGFQVEENGKMIDKQFTGVHLFLLDIASAIFYVGKSLIHYLEADMGIDINNYPPQQKLLKDFFNLSITKTGFGEIQMFGEILQEESSST